MFDLVDCVLLVGDIVIEGLFLAAAHVWGQFLEHAALGVNLVPIVDHREEHVHVHALVDIEEEGDQFGRAQRLDIDLF